MTGLQRGKPDLPEPRTGAGVIDVLRQVQGQVINFSLQPCACATCWPRATRMRRVCEWNVLEYV